MVKEIKRTKALTCFQELIHTFIPQKETSLMISHTSTYNEADARKKGIFRVTAIGSVVNLLLLIFKFIAGLAGHSSAMLADAIHSLSDFITDIVVVVLVRISGKPVDRSHEYGHGKYETLATVLISVLLACAALGIFWNGAYTVYSFCNGAAIERPSLIALIAAVVSVVSKEWLYRYTVIKGKKFHSEAVVANAWHHRSDALSSVGTAIGIGGAILLGDSWTVLDPLAAVFVSLLIFRMAFKLLHNSLDELLEKSLPESDEDEIRKIIMSFPGVSNPHNLRTRRIGNYCSIEVHIRMDGDISLKAAHATATSIENKLKSKFGSNTIINIHLEPTKE